MVRKVYGKKRVYRKRAKKSNLSLTTKVARIQKQLKVGYTKQFLYGNYDSGSSLAYPYYAVNLMNLNTLAPCFGTAASDYNNLNKFRHKSMKLDMYLSMDDEMSNVILTCFVVSLHKNTALYTRGTGALTLTSGVDYINNALVASDYAQTWINPKQFKIHWAKRLILGNNGVAANGPSGTGNTAVRNSYRKILKIKTDTMITNPDGNVIDLYANPNASQQYYLIVFNNNSTLDFEYPFLHMNVLHEIETSN